MKQTLTSNTLWTFSKKPLCKKQVQTFENKNFDTFGWEDSCKSTNEGELSMCEEEDAHIPSI